MAIEIANLRADVGRLRGMVSDLEAKSAGDPARARATWERPREIFRSCSAQRELALIGRCLDTAP
jgi:hypothetical protein